MSFDLNAKHTAEIQGLNQTHAQQQQQLYQKYLASRNPLIEPMEKAKRELQSSKSTLERRSKEVVISQLQNQISSLDQSYATNLNTLKAKQTDEIRMVKYRHSVEPMIFELLSEVRQVKKIQPSKGRSLPSTFQRDVLFSKKGNDQKMGGSIPEIDVPLEITEETPGTWSLGGKVPSGCIVLYTVKLYGTGFQVSGFSDATWTEGGSEKLIVNRNQMGGVSQTTKGVTKNELLDALAYVMANVSEVCPCSFYDCPCPCDCHI
jgi:hypothetical protein